MSVDVTEDGVFLQILKFALFFVWVCIKHDIK